MKDINLSKYGVYEMNAYEMKKTEGGFPWLIFGLGVLIGLAIGASEMAERGEVLGK